MNEDEVVEEFYEPSERVQIVTEICHAVVAVAMCIVAAVFITSMFGVGGGK